MRKELRTGGFARAVVGLMVVTGIAQALHAAEVSVWVDGASAYVFRGDTLNDGLVMQPGLEVGAMKLGEAELPVTLGIWGNMNVDAPEGVEEGVFTELDLYVGLDIPLPVEKLDLRVEYREFVYPNSTLVETDAAGVETTGAYPSDREVSASLSLGVPLAPTLSLYYGVDGPIEKDFYGEFAVSHAFALDTDLSLNLKAKAGYLVPDEGEAGFKDLTMSATLGWKALAAGVAYVAALDDEVLVDVDEGGLYDVKVIGWLGVSQTF